MSKNIQKYIVDNLSTIIKILIIYIIGVVIGVVLFNITDINNEYINIVKEILDKTKTQEFESFNIIANGIKNNSFFILTSYASLLTIISPIIVFLLVILKAIVTGIYICTLLSIFGFFKGIGVSLLCVFLPLVFSICGYIIVFTNILTIFSKMHSGEKIDVTDLLKQVYWGIISISLISFSLVIEQLVSSVVFRIYANN